MLYVNCLTTPNEIEKSRIFVDKLHKKRAVYPFKWRFQLQFLYNYIILTIRFCEMFLILRHIHYQRCSKYGQNAVNASVNRQLPLFLCKCAKYYFFIERKN